MVVSRIFYMAAGLIAVGCCLSVGVLNAQDVVPLPLVEVDPVLPPSPDSSADPAPIDPVDPPETWSRERTTTNAGGDVVNTHQWYGEDGADYRTWNREHTVTNPAGQHSQAWNYSRSDDGYNYERSRVVTLRDGRTIEHTQVRTWDGETGSYQWTFVGPNGQTRQRERAWSPEIDPVDAPALSSISTEPAKPAGGFFARIFGSRAKTKDKSRPTSFSRPGFTIGSGRGAPGGELRGERLGQLDQPAKGPSWRGTPRTQREMVRVHPPHPHGLTKTLAPKRVTTRPSHPVHSGGPL